ncbi:3-ketoacyl-ACP reductase FabG2 [Bosea sp. LjRoot9]|uniref:3-ketoacyl-ACP reductase FabG2 n=1 Tax=Bosea sp. LjRoot9 TaxID=3342341 RepID=UPI003ED01EAA
MSRTLLVTGASKGIGRAIAVRLARDGFTVLVHFARDRSGAEGTMAEIAGGGGQSRLISFDTSERETTQAALEADMAEHGPYFGAILNAGIARDNAFPALSDDDWDSVLDTNLGGFYNVLKPIVMPMVSARKGGRIVTISSVSGIMGNRGQVNYSAAKAGIIGATKALAVELAKRNITVNCVAPGLIDTQMLDQSFLDEALKTVPMRRVGQPEEVAGLVSFLCSQEAAYITRQVISVNGGML